MYHYVQHISTYLQLWLGIEVSSMLIQDRKNAKRSKCVHLCEYDREKHQANGYGIKSTNRVTHTNCIAVKKKMKKIAFFLLLRHLKYRVEM